MTSETTQPAERDKDIYVRDHFDRMTRDYLLSVLSDALIEEHRRYPAHPSEPLARLARLVPAPAARRAVCGEERGRRQLPPHSAFPADAAPSPPMRAKSAIATLEEARHGAFLRHIKDLTGQ